MGLLQTIKNKNRMLKLFLATFVFFALADARHVQPELRLNCNECIFEMQQLGHLVHGGAADITAFLQENYCPTVDGDIGRCKENIAAQYLTCWKWLLTTTLSMVQSIFVRPGEFAQLLRMLLSSSERSQDLTPVRSVWRDWNGYKVTWRTHSGWLNTLFTWS